MTIWLILIVLLWCAASYDLVSYRIPNRLVFIGILIGSGYCVMTMEWKGLLWAIYGFIIPPALLVILVRLSILGAGDVKLLSMAGCFFGKDIWCVLLCSMLSAGVLALGKLVLQQNVIRRFSYAIQYGKKCIEEGCVMPYPEEYLTRDGVIPGAVAIGMGCVITLLWKGVAS